MKLNPFSRAERGQSLAEMALSVTVLLVLIASMADGGRLVFTYISLRDAAQEGVDYGMYNPNDAAGIEARVRGSSSQPVNLQDTSNVTVQTTFTDAHPCAGKAITVAVTSQFEITTPFFGSFIGAQTFPLTGIASGTINSPGCF